MTTSWRTRPETPADVVAVREVNLAAFPSEEEADLVDALRASDAWIDGLSIVAEDWEGRVVAHAVLTRCHVDSTPALALAPCAVLPRVQRKGAGSAAIRAGLDAARACGENLVVVVGHADYYPRFGFIRASSLGIRASFEVPDEALMALTLDPDAETPHGTIAYPARRSSPESQHRCKRDSSPRAPRPHCPQKAGVGAIVRLAVPKDELDVFAGTRSAPAPLIQSCEKQRSQPVLLLIVRCERLVGAKPDARSWRANEKLPDSSPHA